MTMHSTIGSSIFVYKIVIFFNKDTFFNIYDFFYIKKKLKSEWNSEEQQHMCVVRDNTFETEILDKSEGK